MLCALAAGGFGWWLRRRVLIVTVHGPSMLPTYRHGARLLVRRQAQALRAGQVVVVDLRQVEHDHMTGGPHPPPPRTGPVAAGTPQTDPSGPSLNRVVKRVAAVTGDPVPAAVDPRRPAVPPGKVVLLGDNPAASVDSRHYGLVSTDDILGVVVRAMH